MYFTFSKHYYTTFNAKLLTTAYTGGLQIILTRQAITSPMGTQDQFINIHAHTRIHIHTCNTHVHTYTCIRAYIHMHAHIHTLTQLHAQYSYTGVHTKLAISANTYN